MHERRYHVEIAREFFETNLSYVDTSSPEKNLWAACLCRAIADYIRVIHNGEFLQAASLPEYEGRRKKEAREITDYFRYKSREVGSFTWICENISDEPEGLENTILEFITKNTSLLGPSILCGSIRRQKNTPCERQNYDDIMQTG